jgi:hypothetical protein
MTVAEDGEEAAWPRGPGTADGEEAAWPRGPETAYGEKLPGQEDQEQLMRVRRWPKLSPHWKMRWWRG